jgi:hypothetical protein
MEAVGPRPAIEGSAKLLNEDVQAALFAMPKGGFMRMAAKRGAVGAISGAAGRAVTAVKGSAVADDDKPPKQLVVALTGTQLVLLQARSRMFGAPRAESVWRRLPRGSYTASTTAGKVVQRFSVKAGGDALELEAKILGANRPNALAIDAIVTSSALTPVGRNTRRAAKSSHK